MKAGDLVRLVHNPQHLGLIVEEDGRLIEEHMGVSTHMIWWNILLDGKVHTLNEKEIGEVVSEAR